MEIIDFGLSPFREIWERQKSLFSALVERKSNHLPITEEYLMIGEHFPVYTIGFHGNMDNMLLDDSQLSAQGAELIPIERGGDITYHGPGQLIVYPIIDLEKRGIGTHRYMNILEEAVIATIGEFGLKGERSEGATGVWLETGTPDERKICAMGVKCRRFITMHGLALNVSTDLGAFSAINPCGFVDKGVTSIFNEGMKPAIEDVKVSLISNLTERL